MAVSFSLGFDSYAPFAETSSAATAIIAEI